MSCLLALLALSLLTIAFSLVNFPYFGLDWLGCFYPAAQALVAGQNPYAAAPGYFNPPWLLIPLIPFTWLSPDLSLHVEQALGFIAIFIVGIRLGAKGLVLAAWLFSFPLLNGLIVGQVEWLMLLGFILPPRYGLFLVLAKPQIGIGYGIYELVQSWREGGPKRVLSVYAPVSLAYGLSFLIYGIYLLPSGMAGVYWNASLWPQSLMIGLPLLLAGIQKKSQGLATSSAPLLSPYLSLTSWSAGLLGLIPTGWPLVAASIGSWLARALGGYPGLGSWF